MNKYRIKLVSFPTNSDLVINRDRWFEQLIATNPYNIVGRDWFSTSIESRSIESSSPIIIGKDTVDELVSSMWKDHVGYKLLVVQVED